MSSDRITDKSRFSDELLQEADEFLKGLGDEMSLDQRVSGGHSEDFQLFVNNDRHDLHGYVGYSEDGDVAIIVPEPPESLKKAHMIPGDQAIVQAPRDRFSGRVRNTFDGRRDEDPSGTFVITLHPN
ncbi:MULTISPECIES: hypothetical protein [unclassified Guyparkeria]|uniref:hypothetical protein n=1 Tax=unclassified Guyparkeria TaxID=2626246 RepID=UPI00073397A0|nr:MULTISPECIES: hypothetical protein [unclassified Guyparkeria]KTG16223.1 hypothetical protein AUR63_05160 [Guyparkeria sp. XI15]OAE85074.1 hypothetical protein AWR35_05170 [Guyparkeria sp. WRN-7]